MKKKISMIVCALGFVLAVHAQEAKPKITLESPSAGEFKFEHEVFDFGKVNQGDSVYHEFTFVNVGNEPIIIDKADVTCGCYASDYPRYPVKKGEKGVIKVVFRTIGKVGIQDKAVTLVSNAKQKPMVIHLKGTVEVPEQQAGPVKQ